MTHLLKTAIMTGQTRATLQLTACYRMSGTGPGNGEGPLSALITNTPPDPAWLDQIGPMGRNLVFATRGARKAVEVERDKLALLPVLCLVELLLLRRLHGVARRAALTSQEGVVVAQLTHRHHLDDALGMGAGSLADWHALAARGALDRGEFDLDAFGLHFNVSRKRRRFRDSAVLQRIAVLAFKARIDVLFDGDSPRL